MGESQKWFEDWVQKAKDNYDIVEYLTTHYQFEFKRNKCLCPFHDENKPTFSVHPTKKFGFCFACSEGGDIVKLVEKIDKITPAEALIRVHANNGVDIGTEREISAEEKATREKQQDEVRAEANKRKIAVAKDEEKLRAEAIKTLTQYAPIYAEALYTALQEDNQTIIKPLLSAIPRFWDLKSGISDLYIGWDDENESICFINRKVDGQTFNIKPAKRKGFPKDWKFGAKWVPFEFAGKWISWKNASTYPFGLEFVDGSDDRVIICEGEKDALNLMSYGVNALTLGGVSNKWESYKTLLADKRVYIWFDHDKAGYAEGVKRWAEIREVAKSCHVVLFYKLGRFVDKYDISDYLVEQNFVSKEAIFNKIIYSCFSITNDLIDEIIELVSENISQKDLDRLSEDLAIYRNKTTIRKFNDIKQEILSSCKDIKGERDEEVKIMTHLSNELENSHIAGKLEEFINSLFKEDQGFLGKQVLTLKKVVGFKKSALSDYRQTHIYDMVVELQRATKASGYMFAKYRDLLYIWTGNYFYKLEKWEIEDFILQSYFKAAKVDFKKQIDKNSQDVLANLKAHSVSLESWINIETRAINMLNGTLLVPASGKYIFKSVHSKKDCAMNILPLDYDLSATAPKWQSFLNRVLPEKLDQNALMEFFGYCFLPSHRYETFLLMQGSSGANGKSVVLEVMRSFFGRENVSSLQLHEFEGHPLAMLRSKILNIGTEIESGGDLNKQFSALKALTSPNDSIAINPKNKDGFDLHPEEKPKMAFSAQKLPKSGVDGGVFRRALVFEMDIEIKDDEKIRDLVERFEDERAGILNMALTGLTRLIKNNKFSLSKRRADAMEEYKDDVNPIRAYINECIGDNQGVMVCKKFMYEHYKAWAEEVGRQAYADRTFWTKVKEHKKINEVFITKDELVNSTSVHASLPNKNRFLTDIYIKKSVIDEFKIGKEAVKIDEINISKANFDPVFV